MKYWKNGFYDTPIEDAVEITNEYYDQLLAGQSSGLLIGENDNGYPILVEQEAGKTETVLWHDGVKNVMLISDALAMLNALELYALNCYNVTQSHIAAVNALDSIEEIEEYDYKVGYPAKLSFPG